MSNRRKNTTKILASVVLVAGAAGVAGLGTYGSFTSTTDATTDVGTGVIEMTLTNGATQGFNVAVPKLVAGDRAQRAVTLTRSAASEKFGSLDLTATFTPDTTTDAVLASDTNGLLVKVDSCSTAWTATATPNELACSGSVTDLVSTKVNAINAKPLATALAALNNASSKVAYLRVEVSLPTAAGNNLQGRDGAVTFNFLATQAAGKAV